VSFKASKGQVMVISNYGGRDNKRAHRVPSESTHRLQKRGWIRKIMSSCASRSCLREGDVEKERRESESLVDDPNLRRLVQFPNLNKNQGRDTASGEREGRQERYNEGDRRDIQ
jgi:hypothetical protein